jgi:hypothetical protein
LGYNARGFRPPIIAEEKEVVNFKPKADAFVNLLAEQAGILDAAATLLTGALSAYDQSSFLATREEMESLEHRGDSILHEFIKKLHHSFFTPYDHEDLHHLAAILDDVLDNMDLACGRLATFELKSLPPHAAQMAGIIKACAHHIAENIGHVGGRPFPPEFYQFLSQKENEADKLYQESMRSIFNDPAANAIEAIKAKEVLDGLEETVDSCKQVGHVIESMMLKHG